MKLNNIQEMMNHLVRHHGFIIKECETLPSGCFSRYICDFNNGLIALVSDVIDSNEIFFDHMYDPNLITMLNRGDFENMFNVLSDSDKLDDFINQYKELIHKRDNMFVYKNPINNKDKYFYLKLIELFLEFSKYKGVIL